MCLQVFLEFNFCGKSLFADTAFHTTSWCTMFRYHVMLERLLSFKRFAAAAASIWSVIKVCLLVDQQVSRMREYFPTPCNVANKWAKTSVGVDVLHKMIPAREGFVADAARVRFRSLVSTKVARICGAPFKTFAAAAAIIRMDVGVDDRVSIKVELTIKTFSAAAAFKRLLPRMNCDVPLHSPKSGKRFLANMALPLLLPLFLLWRCVTIIQTHFLDGFPLPPHENLHPLWASVGAAPKSSGEVDDVGDGLVGNGVEEPF